jgi:hypothetical protein
MQSGFMRRMLFTSAATVALLTAPAMAVSSFERTTPGFFNFTIDEAGTYQLTIGGATGGATVTAIDPYIGGAGAFFSGSVYLGNGDLFSGLVGGNGADGGGGGLSYFLSGLTKAYVGGGGGASLNHAGYDSNGVGGTGDGGPAGNFTGGGAGVNGNGGDFSAYVTGGSTGPTWSGGTYYGVASPSGGLGGGGAGYTGDGGYSGGGGGGYTGGNGGGVPPFAGYLAVISAGTGGTSFHLGFISSILRTGTDRRSSLYAGDLGGGFFSLTLIPPAVTAVPVPASLGLLGLAIAGLIAQSRRRKA